MAGCSAACDGGGCSGPGDEACLGNCSHGFYKAESACVGESSSRSFRRSHFGFSLCCVRFWGTTISWQPVRRER